MKAIHNPSRLTTMRFTVVYDPAKLVKMKAIHNLSLKYRNFEKVVYDPAKLVKMKAILNFSCHISFTTTQQK